MEKWIIEADIYRLQKQLCEASYPDERATLLNLLREKKRMLDIGPNSLRRNTQPGTTG